jgi:hypothetical protein
MKELHFGFCGLFSNRIARNAALSGEENMIKAFKIRKTFTNLPLQNYVPLEE